MVRDAVPNQCRGSRIGPARGPVAAGPPAVRQLDGYLQQGRVSARGYDRVLRLAWTLADLDGAERPGVDQVGEALYFRTGQVDTCAA